MCVARAVILMRPPRIVGRESAGEGREAPAELLKRVHFGLEFWSGVFLVAELGEFERELLDCANDLT
jgi:hypothetical protein